MTAPPPEPAADDAARTLPLPSARTVLRLCLAAQVLVAAAVMSEDAWRVIDRLGRDAVETVETQPVAPGDQTRRFSPVSVPVRPDRHGRPEGPVALPDAPPLRLSFTMQEIPELGRVLLLAGEIDAGAAARFDAHLDGLAAPPDVIALHSPGGLVDEALRIGRRIRADGLDTLVTSDAACLSSCPYVLAGGVGRTVSRTAWVGLHQHYLSDDRMVPAVMAVMGIQLGQGRTLAYLGEMEIDPLILVHALETPPEDIYLLVEAELTDYRLATEMVP